MSVKRDSSIKRASHVCEADPKHPYDMNRVDLRWGETIGFYVEGVASGVKFCWYCGEKFPDKFPKEERVSGSR